MESRRNKVRTKNDRKVLLGRFAIFCNTLIVNPQFQIGPSDESWKRCFRHRSETQDFWRFEQHRRTLHWIFRYDFLSYAWNVRKRLLVVVNQTFVDIFIGYYFSLIWLFSHQSKCLYFRQLILKLYFLRLVQNHFSDIFILLSSGVNYFLLGWHSGKRWCSTLNWPRKSFLFFLSFDLFR